ncbi:MAG TPA: SgcJ/EcaC family oxidoreductase [Propionibacteriaceae bacterium]|nr:SgcJ/EcaC family oxidoreductase [Propionibacteriaceae bacterium]
MTTDPHTVASDFYGKIEKAWNAADGAAFAEPFAADASFVDIRGQAHDGTAAIGGGHQGIFATVYRGSTVQYDLDTARNITGSVVLTRARATLTVPGGPLAGTHHSLLTAVLQETGDGWLAVAFHNTLVGGQPQPRGE